MALVVVTWAFLIGPDVPPEEDSHPDVQFDAEIDTYGHYNDSDAPLGIGVRLVFINELIRTTTSFVIRNGLSAHQIESFIDKVYQALSRLVHTLKCSLSKAEAVTFVLQVCARPSPHPHTISPNVSST